jgi:citrate synthase
MLISAREASKRLGVKPTTLYAYVSRGLLRSAPGPDSRERRYYAEDVERLRRTKHTGPRTGKPPKPFDAAMPMLDTSISLIDGGRLHYRGCDALTLAEMADLETVAQLLWGETSIGTFSVGTLDGALRAMLAQSGLPATAMDRARVILASLATHDVAALDVSPAAVARTGARLAAVLTAAVTGAVPTGAAIHMELGKAWKLDRAGTDLVRRCLVLIADHELNASTYVGRCIASTGASPYAVLLGALGALSGPLHGGETSRVETLLREVLAGKSDARSVVADRLQRGERIPGFGQPLYPDGDPRGHNILKAVRDSRHRATAAKIITVGEEIATLIAHRPNVDFALGVVSTILELPPGSGLGLFLVGRSVGWIAHAIEQYATRTLIRPRARYIGPLPLAASEAEGPTDTIDEKADLSPTGD